MVEIAVEYGGELHCSARHGPSGSTLATDAPLDNEGRGEDFSPTDLCATSLVTCMMTIMGIRARAMVVDITGTRAIVKKVMSTDLPRRITGLPVEMRVAGTLTGEQKNDLREAAENCPVNCSLHPDIKRPITFIWADGN
jgi:putative redox protein